MSSVSAESNNGTVLERVNWRQVGMFVGLTFGLTWLLDLALYLTSGYSSPAAIVALQFQMLIPAFSAIVLGFFVFSGSAVRTSVGRSRAFFWFYLVFVLIYAGLAVVALVTSGQSIAVSETAQVPVLTILAGIAQLLMLIGLVVTMVLRFAGGRESFARAGLAFGKPIYWLTFGLGFVLFYGAQTLLNAAFGLGKPADVTALAAPSGMDSTTLLIVAGVQSVLLSPFLALLITFGEEYGWRGYLQGELIKLGRIRGIALVGVIWGLWHAPIIMMGHNYPGYPIAGVFLMTLYCVGLAFVLGYAVLKSGSVWLAAFLHGINNQVFGFLVIMFYAPGDPVFSFGAGIYGIATLAVVVALILRDPLWRRRD
jgi:uncharacterized protein